MKRPCGANTMNLLIGNLTITKLIDSKCSSKSERLPPSSQIPVQMHLNLTHNCF